MKIDVMDYWTSPPPEPSPGLRRWYGRIKAGWRPNSRISGMGYHDSAEFFAVYIWEYLHVLSPLLRGGRRLAGSEKEAEEFVRLLDTSPPADPDLDGPDASR